MPDSVELLAPAKINLTLKVLGRRTDGFHDIESLVCPISIFDRLALAHGTAEGGLKFECSDPSLPADDSNLVVRAARLFCNTFGFEPRLRIRLEKEIPHGAGLGGGSSDAAATLLGLNLLFETELTRTVLADLAAELGSDVPLFVHQSAAMIRGRGEHVEPVPFPHSLPLLLIKPSFGVPTPWAYRQWRDSLPVPGVRYDRQELPWGSLENALERPVFEKYLLLATLKTWLLAQPEVRGALMSGSGSTVFAVLTDKAAGYPLSDRVAAEFDPGMWQYLCETIANSAIAV